MVTTIIPAVFAGRRKNWTRAALVFVLAGALGGGVTGMALGTFGAILSLILPVKEHSEVVVAVFSLGYALHELQLIRLPIPPVRRQVQAVLRGRLPLNLLAFVYGIQLGAGIVTRISTAALYVVCLGILVVGDSILGTVLMACYGLVRSLLTMAFSSGLQSMDAAIARSRALEMWHPTVRMAGALSLIIAGIALVLQTVFKAL